MIQHQLDKLPNMATSCFSIFILIFSTMLLFTSAEKNSKLPLINTIGIIIITLHLDVDTDLIEDNSLDALRKALLMNIEKYEVPKIDDFKYTDVKISANIHHIDIQDDQGAMNVHGFLKMVSRE